MRCTPAGKIAGLTFRGAKTLLRKLAQNKNWHCLSYKLATIETDVELELTCEQLECSSRLRMNWACLKNMSLSADGGR